MATFLFSVFGLFMLYYAARGVVPRGWNPSDYSEVGKPMDRRMRILFLVAGVGFCGVGILLFYRTA